MAGSVGHATSYSMQCIVSYCKGPGMELRRCLEAQGIKNEIK